MSMDRKSFLKAGLVAVPGAALVDADGMGLLPRTVECPHVENVTLLSIDLGDRGTVELCRWQCGEDETPMIIRRDRGGDVLSEEWFYRDDPIDAMNLANERFWRIRRTESLPEIVMFQEHPLFAVYDRPGGVPGHQEVRHRPAFSWNVRNAEEIQLERFYEDGRRYILELGAAMLGEIEWPWPEEDDQPCLHSLVARNRHGSLLSHIRPPEKPMVISRWTGEQGEHMVTHDDPASGGRAPRITRLHINTDGEITTTPPKGD